ncbi:MAG: FAD:protein FMN transferase [Gammaproteobacteria bacterium]|nr:FAD:protein FMN transferase [Gammaproteobacteria bacterium]MDH4255836.1 FAD:protein FMN transferase [Gammaproteobacteria bacterium]MDH5309310.1 FAD:protein FMN transferase [Gammaproteobacteria bacterium]
MQSTRSWVDGLAAGRRARLILLSVASLALGCDARQDFEQQSYAFGTLVTLSVYDARRADYTAAMSELQADYRRIDRDWYPWPKPDGGDPGELMRINAALADGQTIDVSPDLADLLRRAVELEARTGGRFNPAIGRLTELWGFNELDRESWRPPPDSAIEAVMAERPSGMSLAWQADRLGSRSAAVMLDLGGIAKGALLDRSARILESHGISNAVIDIGGDLLVLGVVHGRAARIGIRAPREPGIVGWIEAAPGEAVVSSGDYERFFEFEGRRYAHILDPSSGYPVSETAAVTVVHEDPELADAAATALVVAGAADFDQTCEQLGIKFALLIDSSGELRLTSGLARRVNWTRKQGLGT